MTMGADPAAVTGQREVFVGEGDVVSARLPEPAEARELGLEPWAGVPVLSVRRAGQSGEELHDSRAVPVVAK
jgi:hypothetical protein